MKTLPLIACLAAFTSAVYADAEILAYGELAANTRDAHGDTVGGIGSGLVYNAAEDVFLTVSDRGPGDGTLPYRPRVVVLKITEDGDKLTPSVVDSIILKDETGRDMTGLIPDDLKAATPRMLDGRTCIDPEAIALAPDDTLYITDEYGPYLYQFQRDGKMLRRIELPEQFQPRDADGKLAFTNTANLVSGRAINQGPEGMCLLPDGKTAGLMFQSGSVQDGGKPSGQTKILFIDLETGKPKQLLLYPMSQQEAQVSASDLSINDFIYLSPGTFLVLEREGFGRDGDEKPGVAGYKAVWLAEINDATDLLTAPKDATPVPVRKTLLFNLPKLVSDPKTLGAKWEGLVIVPPKKAGEVTLIMAADNDFLSPTIYEDGKEYPFERAKDAVPSQFFKIRATLPENP